MNYALIDCSSQELQEGREAREVHDIWQAEPISIASLRCAKVDDLLEENHGEQDGIAS